MPSYYPIFLDLKGKRCVVVGGGPVAERKVRMLLEHQASVKVISPTVNQGLQQLAEQAAIQVIPRGYRTSDLKGTFLAIAATDDPAINAAVVKGGGKWGALTNVVDDLDASDFIVPSIVRRGDITVAISTAGKSPALARKLRTELEAVLPPEYASLADLVSEIRQELIRRQARVDGDTWQRCLKLDLLLDMVKKGQLEEARRKLIADLMASGS